MVSSRLWFFSCFLGESLWSVESACTRMGVVFMFCGGRLLLLYSPLLCKQLLVDFLLGLAP